MLQHVEIGQLRDEKGAVGLLTALYILRAFGHSAVERFKLRADVTSDARDIGIGNARPQALLRLSVQQTEVG